MMFGFGKKNNKKNSVDTKTRSVAEAPKIQKKPASAIVQPNRQTPHNLNAPTQRQNVRTQGTAVAPVRTTPSRNMKPSQTPAASKQEPKKNPGTAVVEKRIEKKPVKKEQKSYSKIEITPKVVRNFVLSLLASLLLATVLLSLLNFTLYAFNHFDFEFGYDVTVKLEDGSNKPKKFEYDHDSVFREKGKAPYICLNRLIESLKLSTVGDNQRIKFYKTDDLGNYIIVENGSRHVIINGETICISAPVHISGSQVYLPIDFFENYTSSITVNYDSGSHVMLVVYDINEELSTPKRKVLEEFRFVVTAPVGLEEMTEEERNEYAVLSKG